MTKHELEVLEACETTLAQLADKLEEIRRDTEWLEVMLRELKEAMRETEEV